MSEKKEVPAEKRRKQKNNMTGFVPVEKVEEHKKKAIERGWTFDHEEPMGNDCTTHVYLYYIRVPQEQ